MREASMSGLAEGFGSIETATTSGFSLPLSKWVCKRWWIQNIHAMNSWLGRSQKRRSEFHKQLLVNLWRNHFLRLAAATTLYTWYPCMRVGVFGYGMSGSLTSGEMTTLTLLPDCKTSLIPLIWFTYASISPSSWRVPSPTCHISSSLVITSS